MNKFAFNTNNSFVLRVIGNVWLLVDIRNNKLYELNETAVEIYRLFQLSLSIEEIIDVLKQEYAQSESVIQSDLKELISSFLQIGYLSFPEDFNGERLMGGKPILTRSFEYYVRNIWEKANHPYKVKSFELTPRCNFWCYHCYQGNLKLSGKVLTKKDVFSILDKMAEIGVLEVVMAGGEPLIRPDFKEIYTYAKKLGLLVRVFTNGSLIDDSLIALFKELPPEKFIVSIYGMSENTYRKTTLKTGMYDKVINNLEKIVSSDIPLSLKFIVSKLTITDFDLVCQYAREKNAELRYAFYIYPSNDNDQSVCDYMIDVKEMLRLDIQWQSEFNRSVSVKENKWIDFYNKEHYVPQFLCDFPHNQFYVDYTGQVFACSSGMKAIGGNILTDDFDDIWERFINVRKKPMTSLNECVFCDALYYCVNCPSDEFSFYGNAELVDEKMCLFAKAKKLYYSNNYSFEEVVKALGL